MTRWSPTRRDLDIPIELFDWIFENLDKIQAQPLIAGDEGVDIETPSDAWLLTKSRYYNTIMLALTYVCPEDKT